MTVGKNIRGKKGNGKQFHLPYNIKALGKNINWEEGEGTEIFGKNI